MPGSGSAPAGLFTRGVSGRPQWSDRQAKRAAAIAAPLRSPRALETMVRYRGAVLAELFRSLAALEAARPRRAPFRASGRSSKRPAPGTKRI
jgi:hypothetical protein